ncbi:glycosyltransferase [Oxynema sp. CENA135]|uniref:glycosyltransferase n=1 Tax=Oxynema sp. CENA135 TaxID=984206 RepID=UPI001909383E|nr:glycosyltransferase [Oxynema sp. CENA135]MBK4732784.1 glycosyltransferase [Oxynema sp. CENA135]
MPLISVIIPIYNGQKTIQETITSVINQTFKDFDILIINDGSQDSTLDILSEIDDPRLHVFSYPNAGLAVSRNRGIEKAQGKFIAFLDADDLWTADKLEKQLAALQEHPDAAAAYSWTDYIDESSQFLYPGSHLSENGKIHDKLFVRNFIENGSNPLIRRQALTEIGSFDPEMESAADWDMWLRLANRYSFICIPEVQVLYRITVNSMSANILRQEADCLKAIDRASQQLPKNQEYLRKKSLSNVYQYLMFRSLESHPRRSEYFQTLRCFWYAIYNDPSLLLKRHKLMSIAFLKVMAGLLLPRSVMGNA